MSRKSHVAIGPGSASLILIIVTLAMSVLAALTLISARNEMKLSDRSLEVAKVNYMLYDRSERTLADLHALLCRYGEEELEANLPQQVVLDGDVLRWCEQEGDRRLECAARAVFAGEQSRLEWQTHRLGVEVEEEWN